jgi:hypothetical protein
MFVVFFILISLCSRRGYQPPSTQCLYLFFNLIPLCRGWGTDIYSSYIIELISKLWFCCLGPLVVVFPKLGCRVPKAWLSCSQNLVVVFPKLGCRVPKDLHCLTFQSFHFFAYQKKVMPETCAY